MSKPKPAKYKGEPPELAAEVERMKAKRLDMEFDAERKALLEPPKPIAGPIDEILSKLRVVTDEEAELYDQQFRSQLILDEIERREKLWRDICPERYREEFDHEKVSKEVDPVELAKVLNWKYSDQGLYVVGKSGLSKSRAVFHRLRKMFVHEKKWVKAISGEMFGIQAGSAFSQPEKTEAWLNSFFKADVLFLDDLAKRWTPSTEEAAFAIIEYRTSRMKPIIITINNTGGDLESISTDQNVVVPLLRRIKEFCECVIF